MTPQEFHDTHTLNKDRIDFLYEEQDKLTNTFIAEHGLDYDFPVNTKEGKAIHVRVYKPEGFFVYNREFEVGTRVKAKNLKESV